MIFNRVYKEKQEFKRRLRAKHASIPSPCTPSLFGNVQGSQQGPLLVAGWARAALLAREGDKPGTLACDGRCLLFDKQLIDDSYSQAHCFHHSDLDGDGRQELITGERVRAHNSKDPGGMEPLLIRYYVWNRDTKSFDAHTINRGKVGIGL